MVIAAFEATPEDPMPGGELVYLMNDGPAPVDIDCWSLTSQSLGRTLRVLDAEELAPGAAVRLLADTPFIAPVDRLKLSDSTGAVIDRTPRLADDAGDDRIWYRTGDGSWEFGRDANLPDGISDGRLAVDSQLC